MLNQEISIRRATTHDIQRVFAWRNDPWIVSLSNSKRAVTWEEHKKWFLNVINNDKNLLLLIELDQEGIGTVRFDLENSQQATVTIYLLPSYVGRGIGTKVLIIACDVAFKHWKCLRSICAAILKNNLRSIRVFSKVGFSVNFRNNELVTMKLYRQKWESVNHGSN